MRDRLDTIALVGALFVLIAGMAWIANKALHIVATEDCRLQLQDCVAERDNFRSSRDLLLQSGRRLADHLEQLKHDCGKGEP